MFLHPNKQPMQRRELITEGAKNHIATMEELQRSSAKLENLSKAQLLFKNSTQLVFMEDRQEEDHC